MNGMSSNIQTPNIQRVDLGSDGATGLMEFTYGNSTVTVDPLIEMENLYAVSTQFISEPAPGSSDPATSKPGYEEAIRNYVSRILNPDSGELVSTYVALRYADAVRLYCDELKKRTANWLLSLSTTGSTSSS